MVSRGEELAAEIVVGADGFLFNLFERAIEQICEASLPDDRFLARWVSSLETRRAWCAARDIRYVTLITPARHVIYADKLPPGLRPSPNRAALRLVKAIAPALRACVVYPEAELRAARATGEVFLRTDEHMSDFGAYVCYRAILLAIGADLPIAPREIGAFAWSKRQLVGNLGMRLASEPSEQALMLELPGKRAPVAGIRNTKGDMGIDVFLNDNRDLPSAIVFGDSNLHTLLPFLRPHFSRIISVPANQRLYFDLARSEKPDVVVSFISELTLGHEAAGLAAAPLDNDVTDFVDYYEEIALPASREPLLAIDFTIRGGAFHFTRKGWSHPEERHTWMTGAESILDLPALSFDAGQAQFATLEIELFPFLAQGVHRRQRLTVSVGAGDVFRHIGDFGIVGEQTVRASVPIAHIPRDAPWRIKLIHPDGVAPSSVGAIADPRVLSIALRNLAIRLDARLGDRSVRGALDALFKRGAPTLVAPKPENNAKGHPAKPARARRK